MESTVVMQPTVIPVVLRLWRDVGTGWRSRWLRHSLSTSLTHVTLQVGSKSLHTDYNHARWYPTHPLWKAYKGKYEFYQHVHLPSIPEDTTYQVKLTTLKLWACVWHHYLKGPPPKGTCVDNIRLVLRNMGHDVPKTIVTSTELMDFMYDHNRI